MTFFPISKVRGDEVIEWRSRERSKLLVGRAASGTLLSLGTGGTGGIVGVVVADELETVD